MYSAYVHLLYRLLILLQFVSYVLRYRFRKKQRFVRHLLFVTVNIGITFNSIIVEATETLLSYGILRGHRVTCSAIPTLQQFDHALYNL